MEKFTGKAAYQGIAIGKIAEMAKADGAIEKVQVADVAAEIERLHAAKEQAMGELKALYEKALVDVGEAHAEIFEVHQMMLDDDDYNESIEEIIKEQRSMQSMLLRQQVITLRQCSPAWKMST